MRPNLNVLLEGVRELEELLKEKCNRADQDLLRLAYVFKIPEVQ